jgi:hypothetical protein
MLSRLGIRSGMCNGRICMYRETVVGHGGYHWISCSYRMSVSLEIMLDSA